jgi:tRNA threonylcarbamoyl adenosine modification protein YeaZ
MLLAIDTSTRQLGVAFYANQHILGEINWVAGFHATEQLMDSILQLWNMIAASGQAPEAPEPIPGVSPAATMAGLQAATKSRIPISAVAVVSGPGSFSGLRVGMATAKGFCLTHGVPLVTVPSLDAVAFPHLQSSNAHVCAMLHAGRGEYYVGWYRSVARNWRRLEDYAILGVADICTKIVKRTVICGEIADEHREQMEETLDKKLRIFPSGLFSVRRAASVALLGADNLAKGYTVDPLTAEPDYIRRPAAKVPRHRIHPMIGEFSP